MSDTILVEKTKKLAVSAHADLTYGPDDRPYTWHLEKVAGLATRLGYPEEVIAACWLHDIVEDTEVDLDGLSDFLDPSEMQLKRLHLTKSTTKTNLTRLSEPRWSRC